MADSVLRLADINREHLVDLLDRYRLQLQVTASAQIPGSFWGDEEAGLIANRVYGRSDTPVHSILHETCHYICMDQLRRDTLNTDAEGDYDEENAVCYLQILLADDLPDMGCERMMQDMDAWGYTFRLGCARDWFERDAEDANAWLQQHGLLTDGKPNYRMRK